MRLILVTGGVRSGKSRYAADLAARLGGDAVTFIATAAAGDTEMAERIARHRATRPAAWTTLEAERNAAAALRAAATDVVLLDCLTLLASNIFLTAAAADGAPAEHREALARDAVEAEIRELLDATRERDGTLIIVTNEIGLGVVPATELGRWFRDAMGEANQRVAAAADEVVLLVSGLPLVLKA
ncbi:MAG TPA: bifunctional adenosylcobinamide kinase/adenosylcobinamide-phosphate guanylyltransferase [Longimicrobiales bacterium]